MKIIIAAATALAWGTAAARGVDVPHTPAGTAMSMYVAALNSADTAKIQAFIRKYHRKGKPQDYLDLHKMFGDLSVLKIETSEPNHMVALLGMSASDDVLRADYKIDPKDPTRVTNFELAGWERPDDLAIPRLSQAEALKALNARLDQALAQDKFMGVMLIENHGKVLLNNAWGYADREKKIPLKLTDKFRLGSMNKMFTAVATLQLVAKGKLSLGGTVGQYLPDYPNKEIANKATIRMLLTHVGGTGDIFGPEFDKHRLQLKTLADYVKLYGSRAPEFPPGSQTSYSNFGFILLGAIVQKVSGEDYYAYVQNHIFRPAGMMDTGSLPENVNVPGRVQGYTQKGGKWVSNTESLPWRGTPAGGGYSTLADLLRFAHAMMAGKLLPNELRDAATRSQTRGDWYGYGFEVHGKGLAHSYGHSGGAPGMAAELRVYPNVKTVIVALSNIDTQLPVSYYGNRMPLQL